MTLYEQARERFARRCRKHELAPDAEEYATGQINGLSNDELLELISDVIGGFEGNPHQGLIPNTQADAHVLARPAREPLKVYEARPHYDRPDTCEVRVCRRPARGNDAGKQAGDA